MSVNVSDFAWTGSKRKAVELVAQDLLTDTDIAVRCGVTQRTLERWKLHPDFLKSVEVAKEAIANAIREEGIANKQNRVDAYNRRWKLLEQIRAERSEDDWLSDVPGGKTGFVVKQLKTVKHQYIPDPDDVDGKTSQMLMETWESAVDTGFLKEFRELEKQAAQDVGQWTEKREVTGKDGGPIEITEFEVTRTVRPLTEAAD